MEKYSVIIRDVRMDHKLSQYDLAKLINISQSSIARYELGQTEPKASDIIKLCNFFDVSADFLLGLKDF